MERDGRQETKIISALATYKWYAVIYSKQTRMLLKAKGKILNGKKKTLKMIMKMF